MSKMISNNVIEFDQAKERAERLMRARRVKELQNRFERAMGWEEKESPQKERPVNTRKRHRR